MSSQPLVSRLNLQSEVFKTNYAANLACVERLHEVYEQTFQGGGEKYVQRHLSRGKLRPRDRIELLLDRDGYFLELCPLAGYRVGGGVKPGASIVGGIGVVSGVECLVVATESTVKGGAMNEYSVLKTRRLAQIAEENRLPTVNLVESAGADYPTNRKFSYPGAVLFEI